MQAHERKPRAVFVCAFGAIELRGDWHMARAANSGPLHPMIKKRLTSLAEALYGTGCILESVSCTTIPKKET